MLSRHTKRAIIGFFFALVALLLVGVASRHYFAAQALEIRLEQERAAIVPAEPMLLAIERQTHSRQRAFAVRLQPFQSAALAAEVSGRVEEVLVEVGDDVVEGQLLARINPALARLNLTASEAGLAAAQAQLRELQRRASEAERLASMQTVPQTEREAAQAQVAVQEAEIQRLQAEVSRQEELLERHEIRAPMAGTVNQRLVEAGDSVNQNQAVATIVILNPLRARFSVSDVEVGSFRPGQEVQVVVEALPGKTFTATISFVARAVDPTSNLYPVEARVVDPEGLIPGGARGRVIAEIHQFSNMLFIPASAVRFDGRRVVAEVWREEQVTERELEIGPEIRGSYPILAGMDEGEIVIVR